MLRIKKIPIEKIDFIENNINEMSGKKIRELRQSIEKEGIKEPLVLCKKSDRFVAIDGNHRLGVAKALRFKTVPAIIREVPENEIQKEHIILNYFRGEVSSLALSNIITVMLKKDVPISDVAKLVGMSEGWVLNMFEIANIEMPEEFTKVFNESENFTKIPVLIKNDTLNKIFDILIKRDSEKIINDMKSRVQKDKRNLIIKLNELKIIEEEAKTNEEDFNNKLSIIEQERDSEINLLNHMIDDIKQPYEERAKLKSHLNEVEKDYEIKIAQLPHRAIREMRKDLNNLRSYCDSLKKRIDILEKIIKSGEGHVFTSYSRGILKENLILSEFSRFLGEILDEQVNIAVERVIQSGE